MKLSIGGIWRKFGQMDFVLLLGATLVCVCLWAFVEISEEVGEGDHTGLEEKIMTSMRQPDHPELLRGPPWLAVAARDVTGFGGSAAIILITGFTTGYLLLNRRFPEAGFIILAVTGGFLLSVVLKHNFMRIRPEVVPHLMPESSPSFPSGHSMASTVVYVTLGALLARTAPRWRDKVYLIGAALLISGLIGISRVAMGVHYPTDVLAGWIAGTGWALLCWTAAAFLQSRGHYPPEVK